MWALGLPGRSRHPACPTVRYLCSGFCHLSIADQRCWRGVDSDIYELYARRHSAIIPPVDGVDPSMKSALYSGVLDGNKRTTSSLLIPECSTGNCSFPPYASLAVCSKCTNMTSRLSQQPETPLDFKHDFTFHLLTDAGTDLILPQNYTWITQPHSFINMTSVKGPLPFDRHGVIGPSEAIILSDTSTITTNISAASQVYRAFQCSCISA